MESKIPRVLLCYICGKEFKTAKLKAHIPKCQNNWTMAQNMLPEGDRAPHPQPSDDYIQLLKGKAIPKDRLKNLSIDIMKNMP